MGRYRSNEAFSLVEAMVAGVIVTIAIAGTFASLASAKKPVKENSDALKGAYCGQQFLEDLRVQVDSRSWNTGSNLLTAGTYAITSTSTPPLSTYPACTAAGVSSIDVTVTDDFGTGARRVAIQVNWP